MMSKHWVSAHKVERSRRPYRLAPWIVVVACLAACADEKSESLSRLEVVIDADPNLREQLDRIELKGDSNTLTFDVSQTAQAGSKSFPFAVPWVVGQDKTRGSLELRGFVGKVERVRRTVDLRLAKGNGRLLALYLTSSCIDVFKICDAKQQGTCLPCEASCSSENLDATELPMVETPQQALAMARLPVCEGSMKDAGMSDGAASDGSLDDGSLDGSTRDGSQHDAEIVPDATLPEGGVGPLQVTLGPVVAAPGCVPFRVTRENATAAADLALTTDVALGAFYTDAECEVAFVKTKAFARDVAHLDLFFAPTLISEQLVASGQLTASVGADEIEQPLQVRARARQVIRGNDFACIQLEADGSLHCMGADGEARMGFGDNREIVTPVRSTQISNLGPFAKLSTYHRTTCALLLDDASDTAGPVKCWGANSYGQLGRGNGSSSLMSSPVPVLVNGLGEDIVQLSVGVDHACALNGAGTLSCWGANQGQVIDGSATSVHYAATEVTILADNGETSPIREVSTGWGTTCARVDNGKVYCWGNGAPDYGVPPIEITGLPAFVTHIAVGQAESCATAGSALYCWKDASATAGRVSIAGLPAGAQLTDLQLTFDAGCVAASGDLYCWGTNPQGWLGTGTTTHPLEVARRVTLPGPVSSFGLGGFHETELTAIVEGLVYSWGDALGASVSSLGVQIGLDDYPTPTRNPAFDGAQSVMLSAFPGCTVSATGGLACWGHGPEVGNGLLQIQDGAFSSKPLAVAGLDSGVTQVEGGDLWTFVRKGGQAYAFGFNGFGQLGNGTRWASGSPVAISLPGTVLDVAASGYGACAVVQEAANERSLLCWGFWTEDGLLTPTVVMKGDDTLTDVDLTGSRGCAVLGGAVSCWTAWTSNAFDVAPHPAPQLASGVVALEMHDGGANTLCVRKSDHSAWCGFFGVAPTLTFENVASLSAGSGHACAMQTPGAGGKLLCAGHNVAGQLGHGPKADSMNGSAPVQGLVGEVTAYTTGGQGTCAKDSEGWKCWGSNRRNGLALAEIVVSKPLLIAPWVNP